ncbi:MAG: ABC transporter ATP-binding protein [Candidatus Dormibacteria bacterium]
MITFEGVSKRYETQSAVDNLSFEVPSRKFVCLVGPSGCGKTTTLKMINRLIEPTEGRILIDGEDTRGKPAAQLRLGIGYVIQQVGLFPHLTIAENVGTVPGLLGWAKDRTRARVDELLDLVGLPAREYGSRLPSELSGGQRQRAGVARALGADPPILLMDEPFSAIDPVTRLRLQDELLRLQRVVKKTIVFVTHDIDEAVKLADLVAIFEVGGRLVQYDTPADLLARPATPFVEEFLGSARRLRRLALMPLAGIELRPPSGRRPTVEVAREATLREALDLALSVPDGRVAVVAGQAWVGVVDPELIGRSVQ